MNKKITKLKPVTKNEMPKSSGRVFSTEDAFKMQRLLQQALGELKGKSHYWAVYLLGKVQPIVKAYNSALTTHADYKKYVEALKETKHPGELDEKFKAYLDYSRGLLAEPTDLEVRLFNVDWFKADGVSAPLSALLIDLDLMDDPEKLNALLDED